MRGNAVGGLEIVSQLLAIALTVAVVVIVCILLAVCWREKRFSVWPLCEALSPLAGRLCDKEAPAEEEMDEVESTALMGSTDATAPTVEEVADDHDTVDDGGSCRVLMPFSTETDNLQAMYHHLQVTEGKVEALARALKAVEEGTVVKDKESACLLGNDVGKHEDMSAGDAEVLSMRHMNKTQFMNADDIIVVGESDCVHMCETNRRSMEICNDAVDPGCIKSCLF